MRKFGAKTLQAFFMHAFSGNFVFVLDFLGHVKVRVNAGRHLPALAMACVILRRPPGEWHVTNDRRLIGDTISGKLQFFS
jgi:hypothetical protein